jgi:DNA adenine methylase
VTAAVPGPIVKWAGGKSRILNDLFDRFPSGWPGRGSRYLEPFCGGAALFFSLAPHQCGAILGDLNVHLIETYAQLVADHDGIAKLLDDHAKVHARFGKEHYYRVRARWNDEQNEQTPSERAAAFLYLNATCFNGLWRVNKKTGAFNVPAGRLGKDRYQPNIRKADRLAPAAAALAQAKLVAGDFTRVTAMAKPGDLCYLDPPYDQTFAGYTRGGFGIDDQRELAAEVTALAKRGVYVLASNADTDLVRELYRDFRIDRVSCLRSISARGTSRVPSAEVIITTYDPRVPKSAKPPKPGDDTGDDTEARHGHWYSQNCELTFTPGTGGVA